MGGVKTPAMVVAEPQRAPEQPRQVAPPQEQPATESTALALVPGQQAKSHFFEQPQAVAKPAQAAAPVADDGSAAIIKASLEKLHDKVDRLQMAQFAAPHDLSLLESQVCGILREHARLRTNADDRDSKRVELEEKIEALREKNAQVVAEKLAIMEKHALLVSKGASDTLQASRDALAGRDALAERDALQARLESLDSDNKRLSAALQDQSAVVDDLRTRLDAADAALRSHQAAANDKAAQSRADELQATLVGLQATTAGLERRCQEAENLAQQRATDLEAANAQRDDALAKLREAPSAQTGNDLSGEARTGLVKNLMNDTYKQLYAHITSRGADATFSPADLNRAVKSTLKAITAKYLEDAP